MTDERQKSFYDMLVGLKIVDAGIDYKQGYTTQFVCKGVGMDLVKK
jgi:NitT/TauT family transport system substrate-binding protein